MKIPRAPISILLSVSLAAAAVLRGCGGAAPAETESIPPAANPPAAAVRVFEVRREAVSWPIETEGQVIPVHETTIAAQVQGAVLSVLAEEGDMAEKGDLLAEIDPQEWIAMRDQAAAELDAIRAQLDKLREGLLPAEIRQAEASLESARAGYERLLRDRERQERLFGEGMIRESDHEDYKTRLKVAAAELERASAARALARQGFRDEEIRQTEARAEGAEAALRLAELRVGRCRVLAPFRCRIARRHASPGEWVQPGTPLYTAQTFDPVRIETHVPEIRSGEAEAGIRAEVRVGAYPGERFEGRVCAAGAALDPRTRSLPLKISLDNPDGRLKPGMFAEVILHPAPETSILAPEEAVRFDGRADVVYLAKNNRMELSPVRIGKRRGGWVQISEGLNPGDLVIISETGGLPEGAPVLPERAVPAPRFENAHE